MSVDITVQDKTPELMQKLDRAIGNFIVDATGHIESQLILQKNEPKTGHVYPRGKDGSHQASAPGESPASDDANLYPSIFSLIDEASLESKIGTPVEYAIYLEEGTDRMDARPLWEKTAEDSLPTLERMLEAHVGGVN